MDLLKIASRVAAGPEPQAEDSVPVDMTVYDNTQVSADEMLSAVFGAPYPCWFAQQDFGWVAVGRDPATMRPDTPVSGAPFGEKTWGELQQNGYWEGTTAFRQCTTPADVLDENLLWWFTSGDEDGREDLVGALEEYGLDALIPTVEGFEL